jgi:hypothetical protein
MTIGLKVGRVVDEIGEQDFFHAFFDSESPLGVKWLGREIPMLAQWLVPRKTRARTGTAGTARARSYIQGAWRL